jgi:hypothetical protein
MTAMIEPDRHKQLFLDDGAIESMSGVERVLHRPKKHGIALAPDRSRGQTSVQTRSAPQWNPETGLWEWWYWALSKGRLYGRETRVNHISVSPDGVDWEPLECGLYEWQGSRANSVAWDPRARTLYHIVRDERDPDPSRRYKALFDTSERYLGTSPDGFDWTMSDAPPIPSDDESHFFYDPYTEQFVAMVKHSTEWGRSVWLSTSKDFRSFSDAELVFHTDARDRDIAQERVRRVIDDPDYLSLPLLDDFQHMAQAYQMAVMPYEGIYVGFPLILNPSSLIPPPWGNYTALNQIELTVSRDLRNWERVADREVFIGVEPWNGTNYATTQVGMAGRPIVRGDEIWVYHGANRFRGPMEVYPEEYQRYSDDVGAMYLAKLRLDGFVSLDAGEHGTMVSRPFDLNGGELHVNADATGGELRAELLDAETFAPLPGLSESECLPLDGDHINGRLSWGEGRLPAVDRPVRARFRLRDASLYAFWVSADGHV